MKQRNLARWPLFNKPRPEEAEEQLRLEEAQQVWNQEEAKFQLGLRENFESGHERLERLAQNFADLRKFVL